MIKFDEEIDIFKLEDIGRTYGIDLSDQIFKILEESDIYSIKKDRWNRITLIDVIDDYGTRTHIDYEYRKRGIVISTTKFGKNGDIDESTKTITVLKRNKKENIFNAYRLCTIFLYNKEEYASFLYKRDKTDNEYVYASNEYIDGVHIYTKYNNTTMKNRGLISEQRIKYNNSDKNVDITTKTRKGYFFLEFYNNILGSDYNLLTGMSLVNREHMESLSPSKYIN